MATSDFWPEVEIWPFSACAMLYIGILLLFTAESPKIPAFYGVGNTLVTVTPENYNDTVFCYYAHSSVMDLWTRLWGRYHVPQNVFLVASYLGYRFWRWNKVIYNKWTISFLYFTALHSRPCSTNLHHWTSPTRRPDKLTFLVISGKRGDDYVAGSIFAFSHWQAHSPLTQGWYMAHCSNINIFFTRVFRTTSRQFTVFSYVIRRYLIDCVKCPCSVLRDSVT